MKKRIIAGAIVALILAIVITMAFISNCVVASKNTEVFTKEQLITKIEEAQNIKNHTHIMAESARELGWAENDELIKQLQEMWHQANSDQEKYQKLLDTLIKEEEEKARKAEKERLAAEAAEQKRIEEAKRAEEAKWANKAAEYPVATQIWKYMKAQGWNDYVCAGIMGNLMAEVGGQTLNIKYATSSGNYYGMCQWNKNYSKIWGAGLESQCDYLRDTIKYEFDTYGFKYQKGFNFNSFLNMTNAEQAALAFAKSYERCGSGSYSVRQQNAIKAYNYFVN